MRVKLFNLWRKFSFFLLPFSFLYGIVVVLRNFLYDHRVFKIKRLPKPVISVGNIIAGGTGKTPFVEWLAKYISSSGKKVGILSRGYGRKTKGFFLATDGKRILATPEECGDEPFQMALKSVEKNFGWIVAVCEDRFEAGIKVLENYDVDVFILDDGFQRRDLHRDIDIVLFSGDEINEFLIPAGLKREPLFSIKRADVVCFRNFDDKESFKKYFPREDWIICNFGYKLLEIRKFFDYILLEKPFEGKKILAFSGIGKHTSFIKLLKDNNFEIVKNFEFPDHYNYSGKDIARIMEEFNSSGAEFVITTEKDYARLYGMKELRNFPFFYAEIEVEFYEGEDELKQKIAEVVR
ncbi:tetraacyldisaccharide 4'-kinase [Candidatus Chrysopegis kryptomonas]|uniref:Tetraacyldisaccharide 4'-kinase n=1 Tax=Candidatus Chryseopegocella kryptomonas TaxID=1633643 RepID=A0A0P1NYF6_9BACT|nr:tetraacyldisaccharide 4'-kinase [Candidatus Chrysopegis kryptomonas]CUT03552.1 lipid-A-disaccharide kinase [Candidatus Chrysopegis kryptomonas]